MYHISLSHDIASILSTFRKTFLNILKLWDAQLGGQHETEAAR